MSTEAAAPGVAATFIVLKAVLIFYCSWELYSAITGGHKILSFKGIFLVLAIVWSLLRWNAVLMQLIFWSMALSVKASQSEASQVILVLPFALQFALFGLLGIFYDKLIQGPERWRANPWRGRLLRASVVVATLLLAVVAVLEAVLEEKLDNSQADERAWSDVYYSVTIIIYLPLSLLFSWQVYQLCKMSAAQARRLGIFQPRGIVTVTSVLVVVFLTRVAFDFAAAARISRFDVNLNSHSSSGVATLLIGYIWWEDLPLWLLIIVVAGARVGEGNASRGPFARCMRSSGGGGGGSGGSVDGGWLIGYSEEMDRDEWGRGSVSGDAIGAFFALDRGGVIDSTMPDSDQPLLASSDIRAGSDPLPISSGTRHSERSGHSIRRPTDAPTPVGKPGAPGHDDEEDYDDEEVGTLPAMSASGGVGSPGMVPAGYFGINAQHPSSSGSRGLSLPATRKP